MKGKYISRSLSVALVIFVAVFSAMTAFADTDHEYSIDELKLSVKLPTYMDVITRNLSTNDEVYQRHIKSVENFQENDIYLQGFSQDGKQIFTVSMDKDENSKKVDNYNTLDESQLNTIKEKYTNAENCQSCSMDTYNNIIYFDSIINTPSGDKTFYTTKADTLVNGMYIHFTLQSNDGEIDQEDKELMTTILQNVRFEEKEKSILDSDIMTFIWIIATALAVIIVAIIIHNIIKKNKKKKKLNRYDDELYLRDKKERQQAQRTRRNRNTATGAERPDAFFDGVDGIASSENIDQIEKDLIKEAHAKVNEYSEFLDEEKPAENKKSRKKDRKKSTRKF